MVDGDEPGSPDPTENPPAISDETAPAEETGVHVRVPPPVLFFVVLAFGVAANRLVPFSILLPAVPLRLAIALPIFVSAAGFGAWALRTLASEKASPQFRISVERLVTSGPYARSRNPLYVALVATIAAFAALLDNGWLLVSAIGAFVTIDRVVIAAEERYLGEKFGETYSSYRGRVRRWL